MTAVASPYPGLRPFEADEADLLFGREEQVDELLRRLHSTRFLAVVGPSGCGKSSLVRAGMIAALESGFLVSAGSNWQFAIMRPGSRPMTELAAALVAQTGLAPNDDPNTDTAMTVGLLGATLRRGPLGLVEALHETPLPPNTNLLVLVDQFEEIFRFRREGGIDEADAFVALLLESAAQREVPIYVVLTMRSDFFGDCAAFAGLPEALNRSQYLTPRLSRAQRRAAIVGPARVFGGDVAPDLVNRLLNEMGNDPDQLPLMQHLLMRMWTWKSPPLTTGVTQPELTEDLMMAAAQGHTLTLDDYAAVGGLLLCAVRPCQRGICSSRPGAAVHRGNPVPAPFGTGAWFARYPASDASRRSRRARRCDATRTHRGRGYFSRARVQLRGAACASADRRQRRFWTSLMRR